MAAAVEAREGSPEEWFLLADSEEAAARNSMGGQPAEAVLVREVRALRYALMGLLARPEPERVEAKREVAAGWYACELMGHRERYGYVREVTLGYRTFVEVTEPAYVRNDGAEIRERVEVYSASAVFCLTPLDEPEARRLLGDQDIPF